MRLIMVISYLVLGIIGISFAVLNASQTDINLYFITLHLPISLLITLVLGLGIIIGLLIGLGKFWRLKISYKKINNQLKIKEQEIKNLRDIPLKNQH